MSETLKKRINLSLDSAAYEWAQKHVGVGHVSDYIEKLICADWARQITGELSDAEQAELPSEVVTAYLRARLKRLSSAKEGQSTKGRR